VAICTLALGIGANTAIFGLIDAVMMRTLPVRDPSELMIVRRLVSYPAYERLRDRNEVFEGVVGIHTMRSLELSADGQPVGHAEASLVTGNYFEVLGVGAALGRTLTPDDDRAPEASPAAMISYALWTRAFAQSPSVLGRQLRVQGGAPGNSGTSGFETPAAASRRRDHATLTIVGVAPKGFLGDAVGRPIDLWIPMMMQPAVIPGRAWLTRASASWVGLIGRLRPGVTEAQTTASLTVLWRQIRLEDLGASGTDEDRRAIANATLLVEPGARGFGGLRRQFGLSLQVLMAAVGLVLLIACLNISNLLLSRAAARRHEISLRLSLGAGRGRLIQERLTESLLLAVLGGGLGLGVAFVGTRALIGLLGSQSEQISLPFSVDVRILAFTAVVTVVAGLVAGLVPAIRGTRGDVGSTLKNMPRGGTAPRRTVARSLVAIQVGVSLVLLVGAGLFVRTVQNLRSHPVGYDSQGLVLVRLDPVGAGYTGDAIGRSCVELMSRLAALPGVRSITFSENGLFSGTESSARLASIEGFAPAADEDRDVRFDQVGPGYFTQVGIPIVAGRDITERDGPGAPRVAVINETMARFYFRGENPIGRHLRLDDEVSLEVVGVARDARDHTFRDDVLRRMYVSYLQPVDGITIANFLIRGGTDSGLLAGPIREEVRRFNPALQIVSLKSLETLMSDSIVRETLLARLSAFFGFLAVALAAIGLYGVMSYGVARRTNEIGIRMALGAQRSTVALMIVREVLLVVLVGAALGGVAALGLTRFVSSLMFGVTPNDPFTFVAAVAVLVAVGALAGYLPARRAARIDPLLALRYE
jgi:predicted permease